MIKFKSLFSIFNQINPPWSKVHQPYALLIDDLKFHILFKLKYSVAVHVTILPLPFVLPFVIPNVHANAMPLVVFEFTHVVTRIGLQQLANAIYLVILDVTFLQLAIFPFEAAEVVFEPVLPLPELHAAVAHHLLAQPMVQWIGELAPENWTFGLHFHPKPIFFPSFKRALVVTTIFKQVEPQAIDLTIVEVTLVHLTVW